VKCSISDKLNELLEGFESRLDRLVLAPALDELSVERFNLAAEIAALDVYASDPLEAEDAWLMRIGLGDRLHEIDRLIKSIQNALDIFDEGDTSGAQVLTSTMSIEYSEFPEVLIAVACDSDKGPVHAFDAALDVRTLLRDEGIKALLWRPCAPLSNRIHQACVFPITERVCMGGRIRSIRTWLETEGVKFIGCDASAQALSVNKRVAKRVLQAAGITVPKHIILDPMEKNGALASAATCIGFPAVLKPEQGPGGSVGVEFIASMHELEQAVARVKEPFLLEQYIDGRELTIWVIGVPPDPAKQVILELDYGNRMIYDRKLKRCARGVRVVLADLPTNLKREVQRQAVSAHEAIGAYSYSRVDIVLSERPIVLEVNATPRIRSDSALGMDVGRDQPLGKMLLYYIEEALFRSSIGASMKDTAP
jgi:D-alanine-D-alanine ligase